MSADDDGPAEREWPGLLQLVPRQLVSAVLWVVCLAVLGSAVWLLFWLAAQIAVVVVPIAVALFFVALLTPLNQLLRRMHLSRGLAAVCSVVLLVVVLAGVGLLAETSIANHSAELASQFSASMRNLRSKIVNGPLPITDKTLNALESPVSKPLQSAGHGLTSTVLAVTQMTADVIAGLLFGLFVVIFLLYDGRHMWQWFRNLFPHAVGDRLHNAGLAAWTTLTGYVQGTFLIACIHSILIGTALWILGVPMVLPLAILVFLGGFIPLVGAMTAGGFAVLISLGTQGLGAAITLLIVLILENELEAHVLQPFVIGRYVRLHPVAIVTALILGSVVAGIAGVLFSVPLAGMTRAMWGPLNGRESVAPVGQPSRLTRAWHWLRDPNRRSLFHSVR